MKKYIFIAAAFAALLSCSKSEQPQSETSGTGFQKGQQVTLHVTAGEPSTRVTSALNADGETVDFKWYEADAIKVTVGTESGPFLLIDNGGDANGSFTGTMPASGDEFSVQYPYNGVYESDLASQDYDPTSGEVIPHDKMLLKAEKCKVSDNRFTLTAQYAVLRLNLWGADQTISKIVVTNTSSTAAPKPTYTLNIKGGKELSSDSSKPTPFFIVVPAGDWNFSAKVYDNAETPASICSFEKTSTDKYFAANTVLSMPAVAVAVPVISGDFTIDGSGTKVMFSKGNLQATCTSAGSETKATYSWGFAANQWDYIGNAAGNTSIDSQKDGAVVDLFGWVGKSSTALTSDPQKYGISTSTTGSDYGSSTSDALKADWADIASLPQISGRKWKTMTSSEWTYLLNTRTVNGGTGEGYSYQRATINSDGTEVYGLIIYPDNYSSQKSATSYTSSDWSDMENAGCVFLPAAGDRSGSILNNVGSHGSYWSSSPYGSGALSAYLLYFYSDFINPASDFIRKYGYSVRLVSVAQ